MPIDQNTREIMARCNEATFARISAEQPLVDRETLQYHVKRSCRIPNRSFWMLKRGNDLRVLGAVCMCSSPYGISYASQKYLGELAGIPHQSQVSRSIKYLHKVKLIRLLLPKGRPYPGRFQRSNRIQVLFEEDAPLPSSKETMLDWGHRTRRWN